MVIDYSLMLEILGSFFGVLGALIMALKPEKAKYAWSAWLISSFCLAGFSSLNGLSYLFGLQVTFIVVNVIGLIKSISLETEKLNLKSANT